MIYLKVSLTLLTLNIFDYLTLFRLFMDLENSVFPYILVGIYHQTDCESVWASVRSVSNRKCAAIKQDIMRIFMV